MPLPEDAPIQDSGDRRTFESGAQRDRAGGKGRPSLISVIALRRLAIHLEKGALKYDARNWEKGMPLSDYLDSAWRHLMALTDGCEDEDHAAAIVFNVDCYMHTEHLIRCGALPKELDDVPRNQNLLKKPPETAPTTTTPNNDDDPRTTTVEISPDGSRVDIRCGKCGAWVLSRCRAFPPAECYNCYEPYVALNFPNWPKKVSKKPLTSPKSEPIKDRTNNENERGTIECGACGFQCEFNARPIPDDCAQCGARYSWKVL